LQKITLIFLFITSLAYSNELVDALKGVKSTTPIEKTKPSNKNTCDKSIVNAVSDGDLKFFREKNLLEMNNCFVVEDMTPSMMASYLDKVAVLKMFLDAGVGANEMNARAYTPLHYAVFYGNFEAVSLLLDRGAKIDAVNNIGQTPLMIAAFYGNAKTVALLIKRGADIYIRDSAGNTARELAAKKGKKEVVAVIDKAIK
jgi:ankyrin repeat protein